MDFEHSLVGPALIDGDQLLLGSGPVAVVVTALGQKEWWWLEKQRIVNYGKGDTNSFRCQGRTAPEKEGIVQRRRRGMSADGAKFIICLGC